MKNSKSLTISVDSFKLLIKCLKRYQHDLEDVIELYKDDDFETLHPNVKERICEAHEVLPHLDNLELELYGFGG